MGWTKDEARDAAVEMLEGYGKDFEPSTITLAGAVAYHVVTNGHALVAVRAEAQADVFEPNSRDADISRLMAECKVAANTEVDAERLHNWTNGVGWGQILAMKLDRRILRTALTIAAPSTMRIGTSGVTLYCRVDDDDAMIVMMGLKPDTVIPPVVFEMVDQ